MMGQRSLLSKFANEACYQSLHEAENSGITLREAISAKNKPIKSRRFMLGPPKPAIKIYQLKEQRKPTKSQLRLTHIRNDPKANYHGLLTNRYEYQITESGLDLRRLLINTHPISNNDQYLSIPTITQTA
jgi:TATA-binding protein-associated factor Taf7